MVRIGSGVAAAALAVGAALAPSASAASSPFVGTWESTDTDGSHQTMRISGSGRGALAVTYLDDDATVCGHTPARFAGPGEVDGDTLVARVLLVCTPGGNVFGHIEVVTWYLPGTDQLTEPSGVVWSRT